MCIAVCCSQQQTSILNELGIAIKSSDKNDDNMSLGIFLQSYAVIPSFIYCLSIAEPEIMVGHLPFSDHFWLMSEHFQNFFVQYN